MDKIRIAWHIRETDQRPISPIQARDLIIAMAFRVVLGIEIGIALRL